MATTTTTTTTTTRNTTAPTDNWSRGLSDANGLTITAGQLREMTSAAINVPISYYTAAPTVALRTPKFSASRIRLIGGGALKGLPARAVDLASADRVVALDADGNGKVDSFFLNKANFSAVNPITVANLLRLEGVKVSIKDLTNHPEVARLMGGAAGSWNGVIGLSGSKASIPLIKNLSFTPLKSGTDAWTASYSISTGDLSLGLARAAYNSPRMNLAFTNSQLKVGKGANDVSFVGSGQLSLPDLGLTNLSGTLDLRLVNRALSTVTASLEVPTNAPVTRLGISGKLALNHNFAKKSGGIKITDGMIGGIGVNGLLTYSASGQPTTDKITGQLSIDNNLKRYALAIDGVDKQFLSLVPLGGALNFSYAPRGSSTPGGFVNFDNIEFDLVTGLSTDLKASFVGNLTLALDPSGKLSFKEADLTLKNPVSINLGGSLGVVGLSSGTNGAPAKFTLKSVTGEDGISRLTPTLTGNISYTNLGRQLTAQGIGYTYDSWTGTSSWTVDDVTLS